MTGGLRDGGLYLRNQEEKILYLFASAATRKLKTVLRIP